MYPNINQSEGIYLTHFNSSYGVSMHRYSRGRYATPQILYTCVTMQWCHQGGACGFICTQSIYTQVHQPFDSILRSLIYSVNPLVYTFTTLPQPVTSIPVVVHRLSTWNSTYFTINTIYNLQMLVLQISTSLMHPPVPQQW